jgi:hypothetical protein
MPRPQFTLRALMVVMLVVAAFFGGMQFERERRRQADEASADRLLREQLSLLEEVDGSRSPDEKE